MHGQGISSDLPSRKFHRESLFPIQFYIQYIWSRNGIESNLLSRKFHEESLFSFRYYIGTAKEFNLIFQLGGFIKNLYFSSGTTYSQGI